MKRLRPGRVSERGFSLIEIIVVVAIVGVIVGVSIPNFVSFSRSNKLKTSMRQFTGDIRSARQRAVTRSERMMISFQVGPDARTYQIFRRSGSTWEPVGEAKTLDESVNIESTTFTDQNSDSVPDVLLAANGTVQNVPLGTTGNIVLKSRYTDLPRPQFTINLRTPGQLQVQ